MLFESCLNTLVHFFSPADSQGADGCGQRWTEWMLLICSSARFTVPASVPVHATEIQHFAFLWCVWVVGMNTQRREELGKRHLSCLRSFWREHPKRFHHSEAAGLASSLYHSSQIYLRNISLKLAQMQCSTNPFCQ